jgi:hypothetical protein
MLRRKHTSETQAKAKKGFEGQNSFGHDGGVPGEFYSASLFWKLV